MDGCVFCRILAGDLPVSFVHEDDDVVAFLDVQPVNAGHTLVLPRRHVEFLDDLEGEALARMLPLAQRIAAAICETDLRCEGVNLLLADGEAAGQEVPHVHLHVVPRFGGDAFRIDYDWSSAPDRTELDATAARIRERLA
jgi:histidine triad (HIT) family protein